MTVFWLYFSDLQGHNDIDSRNEFVATFYRASFGTFHKKRKQSFLSRCYQALFKTFRLQFEISPKESIVMEFRFDGDEITLVVRPYQASDGKLLTFTLDDMDYGHRVITMADANGLMFFFEKDAKWRYRWGQFFHCLPILVRTGGAILKVLGNIGWRYLTATNGAPPKKLTPTPTPSPSE